MWRPPAGAPGTKPTPAAQVVVPPPSPCQDSSSPGVKVSQRRMWSMIGVVVLKWHSKRPFHRNVSNHRLPWLLQSEPVRRLPASTPGTRPTPANQVGGPPLTPCPVSSSLAASDPPNGRLKVNSANHRSRVDGPQTHHIEHDSRGGRAARAEGLLGDTSARHGEAGHGLKR